VDEKDLLHWLSLSQALIGKDDNYLLVRTIDLCPEKDSRYQECNKQRGTAPSVHNADVNIAVMEETLHDLDRFPSGLSEVVAYARKWQEFGLWMAKAQLAYLESGSVSALEEKHGSVEPSIACGGLLEQIRNAKTTEEAWPFLHHDWWNCVLSQVREDIGDYPQEAWDAFLKANGVKEQPIPETGD
jgi:hypothetical protein